MPRRRARVVRALLSVPVYLKILGIGALVSVLFGTLVGYKIHETATLALYGALKTNAGSAAGLLAQSVARPLIVDDLSSVREIIGKAARNSPDVHYIVVEGPRGRPVAHTFPGPVPGWFTGLARPADRTRPSVETCSLASGMVVEATAPILDGSAGTLRVGLSDRRVVAALSSMNNTFLVTLALCMVLGQAMALFLAYVLTRPIHHLVHVSDSRCEPSGSTVLTRREKEICRLLALGHTNEEVAEDLCISRRTVVPHRASIMAKLGLKSRAELVRYAMDNGFLRP